jgi:hypothetical protein
MFKKMSDIYNYILEYGELVNWEEDSQYTYNKPKQIKTIISGTGKVVNNCIVRSINNTKVVESEYNENSFLNIINKSFDSPGDYIRDYQKDIYEIRMKIQDVLDEIVPRVFRNKKLYNLFLESIGYKTTKLGNVPEGFYDQKYVSFWIKWFIRDIFKKYLKDHFIDNAEKYRKISPVTIAEYFEKTKRYICRKRNHKYKISFYLNSPFSSSIEESYLCSISSNGEKTKLYSSYVLDSEVDGLKQEINNNDILQTINTKIFYYRRIDINSEVIDFEKQYSEAEDIAYRLITNLRLIYENEIGILHISIDPVDYCTPQIRNTYSYRYNEKYSYYFPKRYIFYADHKNDIQEKELKKSLVSLCSMEKTIKGIDIAKKRYNEAINGYLPNEIDRLLDITIALEALYLNDQENKEMSFRLCLRAAKFLDIDLKKRITIYNLLKDLYYYRSRITHGDRFETFKEKDRNRLNEINIESLDILRQSIIKMCYNTNGIDWNKFWLELCLE